MIGSSPSFTVSDFVAVFNQSMDMLYPEVAITGELFNFRISKNQWAYFDLKDEYASVKFFGSVRSLPGPMEDGMLIEVTGRPYLHPQFGFSVNIDSVRMVGEGTINKAQALLFKKLEEEGLFDPARKRELPYPPVQIGLITSSESAAYGDFTKIIRQRWPSLDVVLYDVQVQGRDAHSQIAAAIEAANRSGGKLEVLVIIRGGGSRDDLAAFDHELVVRAVAASRIPTLVAIGHERDVAVSEMAADARASTPSNAAELLVPDRQHEIDSLRRAKDQISNLVITVGSRLSEEIEVYKTALSEQIMRVVESFENELIFSKKLAEALDPRQPLQRGYALPVSSATGKLIKSRKAAAEAGLFSLEFIDGKIDVEVKK